MVTREFGEDRDYPLDVCLALSGSPLTMAMGFDGVGGCEDGGRGGSEVLRREKDFVDKSEAAGSR